MAERIWLHRGLLLAAAIGWSATGSPGVGRAQALTIAAAKDDESAAPASGPGGEPTGAAQEPPPSSTQEPAKHSLQAKPLRAAPVPQTRRQNSPADKPAQPSATKPNNQKPQSAAARGASTAGQPLIAEAYQKSKQTQTDEVCTDIVQLCRRGLEAGLKPESARYARRLMSWAYNRRGELRADQGHERDALADFDAAVALDTSRWRAVHNRGVTYAALGKTKEAMADFSQTIQINPKYANAYFNRGELRYELGDFAAAVEDYTQGIRLAPRDAATYNSRGHAHYRLNRFREALADYDTAIRLEPENAAAYTNRGDAYADIGYFDQAAKDYRAAIRINPQLGRAYQSAAWLMATCPKPEFRNDQLALEAARKAIEVDGEDDYRYLETLAAAQANAGQFDEAQETQTKANKAAPRKDIARNEKRLQLYFNNVPYREPAREAAEPAAARQVRRAPRQ